jgi:DNA-binding transcriptional LysR family regulator
MPRPSVQPSPAVLQQIDLAELRAVVAVADTLNFRKAAQIIGQRQSSISARIAKVEMVVRSKLFVRTTRSVDLTPNGLHFVREARRIISDYDRACDMARSELQLTIGASQADIVTLVDAFAELAAKSAPTRFKVLEEDILDQAFQLLLSGAVHLLLSRVPPAPETDILSQPVHIPMARIQRGAPEHLAQVVLDQDTPPGQPDAAANFDDIVCESVIGVLGMSATGRFDILAPAVLANWITPEGVTIQPVAPRLAWLCYRSSANGDMATSGMANLANALSAALARGGTN